MADGLGLEKISGVVMANQYADLESDSVLAADKTRLDVDGKTYNLNVKSELTDIGETRSAYIHNGTEVLTELVPEGNNVKDSKDLERPGQGITVEKLRGELRINDDTEYFFNFGMENGNHNSEWRLEWSVTFDRTKNGEAIFNSNYANVRNFFDRMQDTLVANGRLTYAAATNTYTRVIFAGEQITDTDLDIMRGIFSSADNSVDGQTPSSVGIDGYVFAGTNSASDINRNKDLSDDMTWRDFYTKYILAGEEEFTESLNGNWLKIVDNNGDGIAEYVFLTNFWMSTVTGHNEKTNTWELENGEIIDTDDDTLETDSDLAIDGTPVLYTYIDGVFWVSHPAPVKMTVADQGITNKTGVKDDILKGTDGTEYDWSEIGHLAAAYYDEVDYATAGITYNLYQDHFGFTRLFTEADGGFALLTDGYYDTDNRKNETFKAEMWSGDYKDIDLLNPITAPATVFVDTRIDGGDSANNSDREKGTWGRLYGFDDVYYGRYANANGVRFDLPGTNAYNYGTNVAAYITDGEGRYTLGRVNERNDNLSYSAYAIDVTKETKMNAQTLYGVGAVNVAADGTVTVDSTADRRIHTTTATEYYLVSNVGRADETVTSWTGYNGTGAKSDKIERAYAIVSDPAGTNLGYSVAEVVVFEATKAASDIETILAVSLGNRQFGQREQAITGLTKNGEEILNLLTGVDPNAKSRDPDNYPDDVTDMLEVYAYEKDTGKIIGNLNDLKNTKGYEAYGISAGLVVGEQRINGIDYVVLSKHSEFTQIPANSNITSAPIAGLNEMAMDPTNLVYIARNTVKDYVVTYNQTAAAANDASRTYGLADNNGLFDRRDLVIFKADGTGANYVINVSNSTWNNMIVPGLYWNGLANGLYQRIEAQYELTHNNNTNQPKVTIKGVTGETRNVNDPAVNKTIEYTIPYDVHQGKDVAFTAKAADYTKITVVNGAKDNTVVVKNDNQNNAQYVYVLVTGTPVVGDNEKADTETYIYKFTFEAPAADSTLVEVPGVMGVNGNLFFPDEDLDPTTTIIEDFVTEVEKKNAPPKKLVWKFESSLSEITDLSKHTLSNIAIASVKVIGQDGSESNYAYVAAPGKTNKAVIVVVNEDNKDMVQLPDGSTTIIQPTKDVNGNDVYAVTVEAPEGVTPKCVVGDENYKMEPVTSEAKAATKTWKAEIPADKVAAAGNVIYVVVDTSVVTTAPSVTSKDETVVKVDETDGTLYVDLETVKDFKTLRGSLTLSDGASYDSSLTDATEIKEGTKITVINGDKTREYTVASKAAAPDMYKVTLTLTDTDKAATCKKTEVEVKSGETATFTVTVPETHKLTVTAPAKADKENGEVTITLANVTAAATVEAKVEKISPPAPDTDFDKANPATVSSTAITYPWYGTKPTDPAVIQAKINADLKSENIEIGELTAVTGELYQYVALGKDGTKYEITLKQYVKVSLDGTFLTYAKADEAGQTLTGITTGKYYMPETVDAVGYAGGTPSYTVNSGSIASFTTATTGAADVNLKRSYRVTLDGDSLGNMVGKIVVNGGKDNPVTIDESAGSNGNTAHVQNGKTVEITIPAASLTAGQFVKVTAGTRTIYTAQVPATPAAITFDYTVSDEDLKVTGGAIDPAEEIVIKSSIGFKLKVDGEIQKDADGNDAIFTSTGSQNVNAALFGTEATSKIYVPVVATAAHVDDGSEVVVTYTPGANPTADGTYTVDGTKLGAPVDGVSTLVSASKVKVGADVLQNSTYQYPGITESDGSLKKVSVTIPDDGTYVYIAKDATLSTELSGALNIGDYITVARDSGTAAQTGAATTVTAPARVEFKLDDADEFVLAKVTVANNVALALTITKDGAFLATASGTGVTDTGKVITKKSGDLSGGATGNLVSETTYTYEIVVKAASGAIFNKDATATPDNGATVESKKVADDGASITVLVKFTVA